MGGKLSQSMEGGLTARETPGPGEQDTRKKTGRDATAYSIRPRTTLPGERPETRGQEAPGPGSYRPNVHMSAKGN